MKTIELKKKLHNYIESGDIQFLNTLHQTAAEYMEQKKEKIMIEEGEEDIKEGRVYDLDEAKKILDDWKVE